MYPRHLPCLKEKLIYVAFICLTFILLMLTLTTTGWEGGHQILHAHSNGDNDDEIFGYYFCVILLALICVGLSIIFIIFSFYKDLIVNNIVFTTRSMVFIPITAGLCAAASIWIPIRTEDSIGNLGYDYIILICATIMAVVSTISGVYLLNKLRRLKPDWKEDAQWCKFIQTV